jgi:hypothetical protein
VDFGVPTNQNVAGVSQDGWDVITDRLIELARADESLRRLLVEALLNPAYCVEQPEVEMRRLMSAIKVADVAGTIVHSKRGDESALGRWKSVWNLLLYIFRDQLLRPLISRRDVRQLKFCLKQLQKWASGTADLDWKGIQQDLKVLEATAKEYNGFPKSSPRRGRRLSGYNRHIIAAVELLRQCGVRDPSQRVVEVLSSSWGIDRESKTVLNLWSWYKNSPRHHPGREAMPHYHIKGMLWLILPAVKAWEKRTGISVVAPQVSESGIPSALRRRGGR